MIVSWVLLISLLAGTFYIVLVKFPSRSQTDRQPQGNRKKVVMGTGKDSALSDNNKKRDFGIGME